VYGDAFAEGEGKADSKSKYWKEKSSSRGSHSLSFVSQKKYFFGLGGLLSLPPPEGFPVVLGLPAPCLAMVHN
jgi:hypothetical protein